jgi:hypothetical protein
METEARGRTTGRVLRGLGSTATLAVVAAVLAVAALGGPTSGLSGSGSDLDSLLGLAEFVVFPASLAVAAVLVAVGRWWTLVAGVGVLAVCGLTICQPFGIVADPISQSQVAVGADSPHALFTWFPPLRIQAYTRDKFCLSDGGCNPDTDAMVRSWLVPGLFDDAVVVADVDSHDRPYLTRTNDGATAMVAGPGAVYRLGYGIASMSGVVYWLIAAVLIAIGVVRYRFASRRRRAADAETW